MGTDPDARLVKLQDVIKLLVAEGYLKGDKSIRTVKPGHGPCCTCQSCGRPNDGECVCEHNSLLREVLGLEDVTMEDLCLAVVDQGDWVTLQDRIDELRWR